MTNDESNPYDNSEMLPVDGVAEGSGIGTWKWGCGAVILLIGFLFLLPGTRRNLATSEAARRTQCKNNLKNIALALHNYHAEHKAFPPAYTTDANGEPLHSWRTLILPYLNHQEIYDQIDLTVPRDHPKNAAAFSSTVRDYQCPSAGLLETFTTYRAIVGEDTGLHPTQGRRYGAISDGLTNCILLVESEVEDAIHWMDPSDSGNELFLTTNAETQTVHESGFQGAMVDGSVRFLSSSMSVEARKALLTVNGGESLENLK